MAPRKGPTVWRQLPVTPKGPALISPRFLRAVVSKGQVNLGAIGGVSSLREVDARPVVSGRVEQFGEAGEASQLAGDRVEVVGVHRVCVFRVRVIPDHALIIPEAPRFSQYVETRIFTG